MDLLVVAVIGLWIVVIALAVVVFALARQVGVLYERVAPAGALMVNQQLKVGDDAPTINVEDLDGAEFLVGGDAQARRAQGSQLLFFLSPDCPICKTLLPVLKSMRRVELKLDIFLLSDGETPEVHKQFVINEQLGQFRYCVSEAVGRSYGVGKLPYAVLIDELGKVSSMGIVNSREHLESLFEAQRLGVASIQDYLNPEPDNDLAYDAVRDQRRI